VSDLFWFLLFIPFALLVPMIDLQTPRDEITGLLEGSFAEQDVVVDGAHLTAQELEVVHRWPSASSRSRMAGVATFDAQWLCRASDGAYLLAMAGGSMSEKGWTVAWTWRRLTESRAKVLLVYNKRAYRRVFGEDPGVASRGARG
jgi:hypothetical protein